MSIELALVVRTGDEAGRRIAVPSGATVRVGRAAPAEARLDTDAMLSTAHFAVECHDAGGRVTDLGSRFGTFVNGLRLTAPAELRHGDEIRAGRTAFGVELAGAPPTAADVLAAPLPPAATPPPVGPLAAAALAALRAVPGPLFAVLDAARHPPVVDQLAAAGVEFGCVFEPTDAEALGRFGPWLTRLPADSPLLAELMAEGWGRSRGVFVTCDRPFADVLAHLRQFARATLPDGRKVFFRFYDPRVLRPYLQTCTADEVRRFVGPLARVLTEGADGADLLEFAAAYTDWKRRPLGAGR